ncbi:hypothetical protein J3R83DRAFT_13084 [Lanmaoa asiatica]|nr:hypothetical protein J3R83DRAFT_13084 [Lanmaoa asiatica]
MAELDSPAGELPYIPDNLTLAQFVLDSQHPSRPIRQHGIPWFIEDHTGRTLGYEEIRARVFGLANGLKHRFGISTCIIPSYAVLDARTDYLVVVWAAHRLGAIMSGANPLYTPDELGYQIQATKASVIVTHPESLHVALSATRAFKLPAERVILFNVDGASCGTQTTVQNVIDEGLASALTFQERVLRPGEGKSKVAFLNFSSGTTGRPKAVAIPHYAPIANVIQLAAHNRVNDPDWEDQRFRPGDICCAGRSLMPIVLITKFNFLDFLKSIVRHKITHLMVVPPQVVLFCKHPAVKDYDFSHVRYLTSGAAPLSRELMERLIEIFPNAAIGQSYGTTESCTVITTWSLENKCDLSGSAGQLIPGITARVEKPDGTLAEFDEPGELVVRTPSLALRYAGNPDAWLRTGDEVKMNRKGEIFVLDRIKEMLKVRGFQVAPAELEGCILDHPDVSDTCVVGVANEYSGELPLAFVVLRADAFFLDSHHPLRPVRQAGVPWLIEDATGRPIHFEELRTRTFGLANALKARYGIKTNDGDDETCVISLDYPLAMWATHRLGGVVSGANPAYTADELLYQMQTTSATLVITHPVSLSTAVSAARRAGLPETRVVVFGEVPGSTCTTVEALIQEGLRIDRCFVEPKLKPGEAKSKIAFLNFSSGTTGKSKAVAISHYGPIINVIQMAVHNKVNQDERAWEDRRYRPGDVAAGSKSSEPMFFAWSSLSYWRRRGDVILQVTLVVVPKFSFIDFLQGIARHKITLLMLVPPQIVLLCKHPATKGYDLSGIRYMMCGAAPLSADLMSKVTEVLPNAQLGQGYGLTESSTTIAMFSTETKIGVPGSAGRLLPGVVARVVKADGTLARFNEPGELHVKMASLALGYWNNEEAWLRTGDEVTINEDKEVFIVDRLKEIMKVKGFQVAPAELEGCLLSIPEVADACVVPVPDEYSGEVPMAFVVLHAHVAKRVTENPGEAENVKADITKFVADNKVAYKKLTGGIEFVDVIPKNPSGKLLRRVLRDRAREMKAKPKAKL